MFVDAVNPYSWVEPVTHLGAPGLLIIAVVTLWRAREAERIENIANQKEMLKHQTVMEQLPAALDRLRTDTIQEIRQGFQACGIKSARG